MNLLSWFLHWMAGAVSREVEVSSSTNPLKISSYANPCVEIGPALGNYPKLGHGHAVLFPDFKFKENGVIMAYSYYNKKPNVPVYAAIYREEEAGKYRVIGKSLLRSDKEGKTRALVGTTVINVREGDFIGLHYESGQAEDTIPFAEAPNNLCAEDGDCLTKDQLYTAHSLSLYDDDINVGELVSIKAAAEHKTSLRAPALNAIFCSRKAVDESTFPIIETTDAPTTVKPADCFFPFTFRSKEHFACTDESSPGQFWCSTVPEYDGRNWRLCGKDDQYIDKMPCKFPFRYNGTDYNSCIKANSMNFWCSVVDNFGPNAWRACTADDTKPEDLPCHYPFLYNGVERYMCVIEGSVQPWCGVSPQYGPDTWKYCSKVDRIPATMACHYPFKHEDIEYNTCISSGAGRPWCSVEAEYREDNWRYCREGDIFPERESCHFPFLYKGQETDRCITVNSVNGWCGTTRDYDTDGKWKDCLSVDLKIIQDQKATSLLDAAKICAKQNMVIATTNDVQSAFETGTESCGCGWVGDGELYALVRNPLADCNQNKPFGVHKCNSGAAADSIVYCVNEAE